MYVANNFSMYQQLRFSDYVSKRETYVLRLDYFFSTLQYLRSKGFELLLTTGDLRLEGL